MKSKSVRRQSTPLGAILCGITLLSQAGSVTSVQAEAGRSRSGDTQVVVQLVAVAQQSGTNLTQTLPSSILAVNGGEVLFIEMWATTTESAGFAIVSADLQFDPELMQVVGVAQTSLFNALPSSVGIDNGSGFIDDVSGAVQPSGCSGQIGFGEWARVAVIESLATATGSLNVACMPSGSQVYVVAVCGSGVPPSVSYQGIGSLGPELTPLIGDDKCVGGSSDGASCSTGGDCPGGVCGNKSRYISITVPAASVSGSDPLSIQVTIVDIDDALGLDAREGGVWWAGLLVALPNAPNASLSGARVVCEAAPSSATVWPSGPLHLFGPPIVPGSRYEVRLCSAAGMNCSQPLTVETGKWGDIVAGFGGATQPNFGDISKLVDKFKEFSTAPDTSRTDLLPDVPDQTTNFADISADVDAFKGAIYPLGVPVCP